MQVKIFVKEDQLEEIKKFLKSGVLYEHSIEFSTQPVEGTIEVQIFYDDYVALDTWRIYRSKI
jgi:hypothetical protein